MRAPIVPDPVAAIGKGAPTAQAKIETMPGRVVTAAVADEAVDSLTLVVGPAHAGIRASDAMPRPRTPLSRRSSASGTTASTTRGPSEMYRVDGGLIERPIRSSCPGGYMTLSSPPRTQHRAIPSPNRFDLSHIHPAV